MSEKKKEATIDKTKLQSAMIIRVFAGDVVAPSWKKCLGHHQLFSCENQNPTQPIERPDDFLFFPFFSNFILGAQDQAIS